MEIKSSNEYRRWSMSWSSLCSVASLLVAGGDFGGVACWCLLAELLWSRLLSRLCGGGEPAVARATAGKVLWPASAPARDRAPAAGYILAAHEVHSAAPRTTGRPSEPRGRAPPPTAFAGTSRVLLDRAGLEQRDARQRQLVRVHVERGLHVSDFHAQCVCFVLRSVDVVVVLWFLAAPVLPRRWPPPLPSFLF